MGAGRSRARTTWEVTLPVWRIEDRPEEYQDEAFINSQTVDTILALKKAWEEQVKKEEKGEETFKKDPPLPTRQYEGGPDNRADLIHPASMDRLPIQEPKYWFHKLATKRKDTYRRLPLDHLGSGSVISEHTIVRAHDRTLPLMLKMFMPANYGKRSFNATENKVNHFTRSLHTKLELGGNPQKHPTECQPESSVADPDSIRSVDLDPDPDSNPDPDPGA